MNPAAEETVRGYFAAYRLADGKIVARIEFSASCSPEAILETTRRIMTRMVGPFSDDAPVEGGMLHCRFASCCANVETQKQADGGLDVLWFFHKSPPASSELMMLLAAPGDPLMMN